MVQVKMLYEDVQGYISISSKTCNLSEKDNRRTLHADALRHFSGNEISFCHSNSLIL
jgi:hypothetical protein